MSGRCGLLAVTLALPAALATADPAAWRIAGERNGEVTLLGSMHVLRAGDHPLPASVDELIERAEVIVMELDLDDVDAAAQQRVILGAATLARGATLDDVIDADVYRLTEQRTVELGVDLKLLSRFEPWFLAVTLLELGMRKVGFEAERGLERYVLAATERTGKEIVGLESLEFQIGIFDSLSGPLQQAMLEQTLAELDEAETAMVEMANAWRNGELEALSDELLDDFDEFPGLYDTLVTNRNRAWLTTLERLLGDGRRYLVVVGALHLVGENSVVEMLSARGHRVLRLH